MQTFFTSDTHFDDEFAISYFNRPFKSVDKVNCIGLSFDIGMDCTEFTPLSLRRWLKRWNSGGDKAWSKLSI